MDIFDDLLFARGFLYSSSTQHSAKSEEMIRRGWRTVDVPSGLLIVHPNAEFEKTGNAIRIGHFVNPLSSESGAETLARISKKPETVGELTGRFIVLVFNERTTLLRDAAGLLGVFATKGAGMSISSHLKLLAEHVGANEDLEAVQFLNDRIYRQRKLAYLPGDRTLYSGIRVLPANHRYDLTSGDAVRIFPSIGQQSTSAEQAVDIAMPILEKSLRLVPGPLSVSLTGGVDSRTTAALLKKAERDFESFTYVNPYGPEFGSQMTDAVSAKRIARMVGARHRTGLVRLPRDKFKAFLPVWKENTGGIANIEASATAYWFAVGLPKGSIHVKSSTSEVFRSFWRKRNKEWSTDLPRLLAQAYGSDKRFAIDAFSEYCRNYNLNDDTLMGHDPLDIIYWEQRMACWQAQHMITFGAAQETFVPYNNAIVLSTLLSAPVHSRKSSDLNKMMINRASPGLTKPGYNTFFIPGAAFNRVWRKISPKLIRRAGAE